MKIKKGFVTQKIGDKTIVVSAGELSRDFHGMIEFNYTGADIWQWLSEGLTPEQTAEKMSEKYGIDMKKARQGVQCMVDKMREHGVIEDA